MYPQRDLGFKSNSIRRNLANGSDRPTSHQSECSADDSDYSSADSDESGFYSAVDSGIVPNYSQKIITIPKRGNVVPSSPPAEQDSILESTLIPGKEGNRYRNWTPSPIKDLSPSRLENEHLAKMNQCRASSRKLADRLCATDRAMPSFSKAPSWTHSVPLKLDQSFSEAPISEDSYTTADGSYYEDDTSSIEDIAVGTILDLDPKLNLRILVAFSPQEIVMGLLPTDRKRSNRNQEAQDRARLNAFLSGATCRLRCPPRCRDLVCVRNSEENSCYRAVVIGDWQSDQDWCTVVPLDEPYVGKGKRAAVPLNDVYVLPPTLLTGLPCWVCELREVDHRKPIHSRKAGQIAQLLNRYSQDSVRVVPRSSGSRRNQVDLYISGERFEVKRFLKDGSYF